MTGRKTAQQRGEEQAEVITARAKQAGREYAPDDSTTATVYEVGALRAEIRHLCIRLAEAEAAGRSRKRKGAE